MANISLKGEDILLKTGKTYFVIDALYLVNIRDNLGTLDISDFVNEIREKVFPYSDTPFAILHSAEKSDPLFNFKIESIVDGRLYEGSLLSFSSDTGLIVFIERSAMLAFVADFDYDRLVESKKDLINLEFWSELEEKFGPANCGLILSPGINKGFEFIGSGLYKIDL